MAKLLSGRQRILNVGVSSSTESLTSLSVIGKVGIGTTNASSNLQVNGDVNVSGIATISGLKYPSSDGANLQVIATNGSGVLSFQSLSSLSGFGWGDDADFGLISDSAPVSTDSGLISEAIGASYILGFLVTSGILYPDNLVLPSFTVSTLPSPTPVGQLLFVTDETGGSVPAFSDGTNWRRLTDRAIVS